VLGAAKRQGHVCVRARHSSSRAVGQELLSQELELGLQRAQVAGQPAYVDGVTGETHGGGPNLQRTAHIN